MVCITKQHADHNYRVDKGRVCDVPQESKGDGSRCRQYSRHFAAFGGEQEKYTAVHGGELHSDANNGRLA